ncbi:MAG: PKD domain-containing protein [Candidatus Moranbacteria bacterium]|nr:PKD domain-containing protein [Candidatus Moranbacteria bacterium]
MKIENGEGKLCGPEINLELNQEEIDNKFKYQIDQVCVHPTVEVILKDGISGEVLAKSNFSFTSPEELVKKSTAVETETTDEKDSAVILGLIIFGGLAVFLAGIFFLIKKRNKLVLKVLLLLFFSGFCFLNEAKADSVWLRYSVKAGGKYPPDPAGAFVVHDFLFGYSLNKTTYSPGEEITAKAWMENATCNNSVYHDFIKITLPPYTSPDGIRYGYGVSSLSFIKAAPITPGTYYASFYWEDLRYRFAKDFPTSGTFFDDVYYANKAVQLNSKGVDGRTDWTAAEAETAISAAGLTAWSHYLAYGEAEGVSGYLYAYDHNIYTSDFSGNVPSILKYIDFTVTDPAPANTSPQAVIDTPTTNQTITAGNGVSFSGHGTDSDGDAITAYKWRLSNCSSGTLLSSSSSFSSPFASAGTYIIYLSVQDSKGAWSTNCPSRTITVQSPTYSCTGTRPANTSIHSGDTTSLTANTPWTYSATNTSPKCQYYCNSGYTWNGSLCRLNAKCGTATNGRSYCDAPPTEDLCAVGSSSTVTSTGGNWTWTCSSVSGTTQDDASCSATVQTTGCGSPGNWREVNP